jgi:adenosine deaminase
LLTTGQLLQLPKAELHVHLDGSLRPATLLELARARGVALPAGDSRALARALRARTGASLEEYLEPFRLTLAVLQDAEAIERVASELVEDNAAETVRWLEVRFCPALSTERGLSSAEVLEAALRGLSRGSAATGTATCVIVCALRTLPPALSREMAELAAAYAGRGVSAFDLAGAEAGYPVRAHLEALRVAERSGLAVTVHAGEAYGPESIRQALELGRAARIGHGTSLAEDPGLLAEVRARGITLEVCLTSNVQTGAAGSYAAHPLRRYFDEGIRVALCTDNRLVSGVTLTREYEHARDALGFTWDELARVARMGFESAFAPPSVRESLLADFDRSLAGLATRGGA